MHYIFIVILLFSGCSFKEEQLRHLSLKQCQMKPWSNSGVYEVELPSYFIDDRFVYKSGERIGYMQEKLARDPQHFLSECAVRELGACLYPWECKKRPKRLYYIKLEEFYFDKDKNQIVLIATVNHRRYDVKERVKGDVIEAAVQAFKRLLAQIGR